MNYKKIMYKGIEIEIDYHQDAENPWDAWDCNLPINVYANDYRKSYGKIAEYLSGVLTDNQIIYHQKSIAEWFDIDLEYFVDYDFSKEDKISDIRSAIEENENNARFVYICELAKIPHLYTSRTGYSQGDHLDIFVCPTEAWIEESGCKNVTPEMLESAADLYGAWAFGDVFGFNIEEFNDSCWGYYGDDLEKSGLLEEARSVIDYEVKKRKEARFRRLKQFIKNRVSYHIRGIRLNHECFKLA